jgi:hypothetical protein
VAYYPLADRPRLGRRLHGWAARLGGAAALSVSPLVTSSSESGDDLPTSAHAYRLGARARLPIDALSLPFPLDAVAGLDLGWQSFTIGDPSSMPKPPIPSVSYTYLRPSVRVARPFGPIDAAVELGYRFVLGQGEIASDTYFPHAHAAAIDAAASATYPLPWLAGLRAEVSLDLERYFFALHPEPGDPWVAGGAVDQYVGVSAGLTYSR